MTTSAKVAIGATKWIRTTPVRIMSSRHYRYAIVAIVWSGVTESNCRLEGRSFLYFPLYERQLLVQVERFELSRQKRRCLKPVRLPIPPYLLLLLVSVVELESTTHGPKPRVSPSTPHRVYFLMYLIPT